MNFKTRYKIVNIFVIGCLFFVINAQAQVNADLELQMAYPQNNQIIPFGDSVRFSFFIINHGPEDIVSDTLLIGCDNAVFGGAFIGDLPVGDTGIGRGAVQWKGEGSMSNDTMNMCYYFRNPVSLSNRVIDSNATNDTACLSYVLLGDSTTGIASAQTKNSIKLFPNPASSMVTIQLNAARYKNMQLSVTDIYGRETLFHDYLNSNKSGIQFDVTGLQPGIYFVHLTADGQTFTNKLVVR